MTIITIGIDLAKNIFAVHGVNESGQAELVKPKLSRDQLLPLIANLPPCLIGMEACSGAHHWARLFREYGRTIKLMAPNFVTPYRMSGKRGKALTPFNRRTPCDRIAVRRFNQQVVMVAHQAIGVDHPVESINRFGQHLQKQRPVGVVPIDILPPVTTRSDVIKAVREFEAEWACHGGIISKTGRIGKKKDLTP